MGQRRALFHVKNGIQKRIAFLSFNSKIKENKNASEIIKTVNMLVSSMNSEYLWEYMTRRFCTSLRYGRNGSRLRCLLTFLTICL